MIVTLTPNTGLDYTLLVPHLQLNSTMRATENVWGMGAKGTDVAWILGKLGVPVMALGFAAGSTGLKMENMLRERGVRTDFVWVGGDTRLNIILVFSDGSGHSTFTSSSLIVSPEQQFQLQERYVSALEQATCVVLGGSLPAGLPDEFYQQLIRQAKARSIPVIFDASGAALKAGLEACPSLIKPNRDELGHLVGPQAIDVAEVAEFAGQIYSEYGTQVIVTLGAEGAVAVFGDRSYHITPLSVPVASAAGAGDGVLAGMALAFSRREPLENGLKYGFALAGAIVQTLVTADFHKADYQALLSEIDLLPL